MNTLSRKLNQHRALHRRARHDRRIQRAMSDLEGISPMGAAELATLRRVHAGRNEDVSAH